ncbi:SEC-C domain-containing protein [Aureibacillus halotolerans]|uniref:SEC-C domain-containing protein n=1 Tax=Aureibacillus halotolerans TaxID=1508390 RepID=UPI00105EF92A|nr:SEC-C domain-containing protein [Aureibacillus halotolerans]
MNKDDILEYLKGKIPDYSNQQRQHALQFSLYVYPFLMRGEQHPFISNLVNALFEIEEKIPGYSSKTIDWISKIKKKHFEQMIQILGEVGVLRKFSSIAKEHSIELEPRKNKGKNPEFRGILQERYISIEVKTASLFEFNDNRQTGLQITSHLDYKDYSSVKNHGKIINPLSLKVKDYLHSANEKFKDHKKNNEYVDDLCILFIIWDDYINEPLSALINPNSGLFTKKSFSADSNFENVDGVIIIRNIHQLFRNLRFGEIVDYGVKGWFDPLNFSNPSVPPIFVQNPTGKRISKKIFERFNAFETDIFTKMPIAEYRPTDFVDWKTGISVSGLYSVPSDLREIVLEYFIRNNSSHLWRSYSDIALFGNIDVERIYESAIENNEDSPLDYALETIKTTLRMQQQIQRVALEENAVVDTRRVNLNNQFRLHYHLNKMTGPSQDCPCNSGVTYKECCSKKLRHFHYTNYSDI